MPALESRRVRTQLRTSTLELTATEPPSALLTEMVCMRSDLQGKRVFNKPEEVTTKRAWRR